MIEETREETGTPEEKDPVKSEEGRVSEAGIGTEPTLTPTEETITYGPNEPPTGIAEEEEEQRQQVDRRATTDEAPAQSSGEPQAAAASSPDAGTLSSGEGQQRG